MHVEPPPSSSALVPMPTEVSLADDGWVPLPDISSILSDDGEDDDDDRCTVCATTPRSRGASPGVRMTFTSSSSQKPQGALFNFENPDILVAGAVVPLDAGHQAISKKVRAAGSAGVPKRGGSKLQTPTKRTAAGAKAPNSGQKAMFPSLPPALSHSAHLLYSQITVSRLFYVTSHPTEG